MTVFRKQIAIMAGGKSAGTVDSRLGFDASAGDEEEWQRKSCGQRSEMVLFHVYGAEEPAL
jgi:hypothetical protein